MRLSVSLLPFFQGRETFLLARLGDCAISSGSSVGVLNHPKPGCHVGLGKSFHALLLSLSKNGLRSRCADSRNAQQSKSKDVVQAADSPGRLHLHSR